MSRIRLVLLSSMAVLVVSAIGASSAFATFTKTSVKCEGTGVPTVCLSTTEKGTELFEASGTESIANVKEVKASVLKVTSIGLEIQCTTDAATGQINQTEPLIKAYSLSKFVLKFSTCKVTGAHEKECKVVEPMTTKNLTGTLLSEKEIEAKPESGEIFTEIEIGNQTGQTCPATIKGVNPVKGAQICTLPENTVDLKTHKLACAAGTKLKFGSNEATFEGEASFELGAGTISDSVLA